MGGLAEMQPANQLGEPCRILGHQRPQAAGKPQPLGRDRKLITQGTLAARLSSTLPFTPAP